MPWECLTEYAAPVIRLRFRPVFVLLLTISEAVEFFGAVCRNFSQFNITFSTIADCCAIDNYCFALKDVCDVIIVVIYALGSIILEILINMKEMSTLCAIE